MKLFDMHCHILPGVDDGAKNFRQTREMLRMAYDDGVRAIIFTPHANTRNKAADANTDLQVFVKVRQLVAREFPGLKTFLGQENYYTSNTLEKIQRGELLTMNGSDYVLLEFSPKTPYAAIRDAVYEFYEYGMMPIIAHIERYSEVVAKPERVTELVKLGAYVQINAGTITAGIFNPMRRFAFKLIQKDEVHFIGSDAHNTEDRAPDLLRAAQVIEKKFGTETARELFWTNPISVVRNVEI